MSSPSSSRAAYRAHILVEKNVRSLAPGQTIQLLAKVRNDSPESWPGGGSDGVNLSYHWLDKQGKTVVRDGRRAPLPCPLRPGQETAFWCMVEAPQQVGSYQLEIDLVHEKVCWFKDRGSRTLVNSCEIAPAHSTHRLHYSGNQTEAEFRAACAQQEWWYHSYYFDNGYSVRGDYDIGRNIHEYGFPDDMTGMKVLDIGTAGGWYAFYFAQRGAEVTAVDIRGCCDYDEQGRFANPPVETEKPVPDAFGPDGKPLYFSRVSRGFWIMHNLLNSNIKYVNARAYDICPALFGGQKFDLVFMGALLLHLRDPVGAIMAARSVCKDRLIATTRVVGEDEAQTIPQMDMHYRLWWFPNKACYRRWFIYTGFRHVDIDRTVMVSAEAPLPSMDSVPGDTRNVTQIMQLADARV